MLQTGDLQEFYDGSYQGTLYGGGNASLVRFNVPTQIAGVWRYWTTGSGGNTSNSACAVVTDANGVVLATGPYETFTVSGWHYSPLTTPLSVSAGTDYYVGHCTTYSNVRYTMGYGTTSVNTNTVNSTYMTVYNTSRGTNNSYPTVGSTSGFGSASSGGYLYNIGVRIQWNSNTPPSAFLDVLSSGAGYLISPRPRFVTRGTDPDGSNLEHYIQIATDSGFSNIVVNTWATHTNTSYPSETGNDGWVTKGVVANNAVNYYTPPMNLAAGNYYARTAAWDGTESGAYSSTTVFTIVNNAWTTAPGVGGAISKYTIDEIRTVVNAVRQARGLAAKTWTDDVVGTVVNIYAVHLTELRNAIQEIYNALGLGAIPWTDATLDGVKGTHWLELRSYLAAA